ncbi:hypothetical protein DOT_3393 [Desulfosporosinus sp. OT]|nr:hypothetical protein DOT_3393 [Desulfosporosinus sp. OT]
MSKKSGNLVKASNLKLAKIENSDKVINGGPFKVPRSILWQK